ncbi:hypothetical protein L198_01664 [Cryptococcus wingfieldii CBS 7118]|uniref:Alginate lyase domain-containing protein n=1 Tax=Cryptococcus wingfieldii CBS 7118 TaxID=1295528 RepID=A0A1E3K2J1_9TREE|nr:hypothetical protein L198_01664 [Cryptococcus wingfieldii CBS 7118]ODO06432.1 hypothetical protein L198_01664 [Cryptococcus wingfieldii CBS 7118]
MCENWSKELWASAPWSVINKTVTPPSGDLRDYMSFAVYYWPDCSEAGNTTELADEEMWNTCKYVRRDGIFNPDIYLIQNPQALINVSNYVFLTALAYASTGNPEYSANLDHALHTFFVNEKTKMNPNLNYAQIVRGPGYSEGKHTGVLDMTVIAKIISGVNVMKALKPAEWRQETEDGFLTWVTQQITWMETSELALQELASPNNHATFAYNQLSALYAFVGNNDMAKQALEKFYNGVYLDQIWPNGDQYYESMRTRPYHYRAYNLLALITNAEIGDFVGLEPSGWERKTNSGTGLREALEFAMQQDPEATKEDNQRKQLAPSIAAAIRKFGDPDGKYADFLYTIDPYYINQPWYALNAGISDSGIKWGILETTYGPIPAQPTLPVLSKTASHAAGAKRTWAPRGSGPMAGKVAPTDLPL